jgi:DNA-binding MarR family transcriptional regulator
VRDAARGTLLSANQASILDHLDEIEPTALVDLAAHMGVTPSTMSLAVDRLVNGGYVGRAQDASDRRRLHLRLTPAGVRVRSEKSVLDPARVAALLACLSARERAEALHGLALLARAAGEAMKKQSRKGAWWKGKKGVS